MELQWPLILFTTFVAWSAGLFASQCILAAIGGKCAVKTAPAQFTAWICSAVLLIIGVVAVFFHLEHWERIFNGFGHITSGITQELIAIVILVLVALAYLVTMRKSSEGLPSAGVAWAGVVISVVLVIVMAHSYTMASRPAWDSFLWIAYVLGNACVLGPATLALIIASTIKSNKEEEAAAPSEGDGTGHKECLIKKMGTIGSAVAAVTAVAYGAVLQTIGGSFNDIGLYADPTAMTSGMVDVASAVAAQVPLIWAGGVLLGTIVPLLVFVKFPKAVSSKQLYAGVAVVAAFVGGIIMRVAFYNLGISMFVMY